MTNQPTKEEMISAIEACKEVEAGPLGSEAKRVCRNTRLMLERQIGRPRKSPVQEDQDGHRYVEVMVRAKGNTGAALVPVSWVGRTVRVTLMN